MTNSCKGKHLVRNFADLARERVFCCSVCVHREHGVAGGGILEVDVE